MSSSRAVGPNQATRHATLRHHQRSFRHARPPAATRCGSSRIRIKGFKMLARRKRSHAVVAGGGLAAGALRTTWAELLVQLAAFAHVGQSIALARAVACSPPPDVPRDPR